MCGKVRVILLVVGLVISGLFLEGSSSLIDSSKSVHENKREIFKFFTEGGDLNHTNNIFASEVLNSRLPEQEKSELLIYLFEFGYSPNSVDQKGNTLLHSISANTEVGLQTRLELIRSAVKYGADIYALNDLGDTPMFTAVNSSIPNDDKLAIVILYIKLGFDINRKNTKGQSLLHLYATQKGMPLKFRTKVINTLILHGADTSAVDGKGVTPLEALQRSSIKGQEKALIVESFLYNEELNFRKLLANSYGISGTTVLLGNHVVLEGLYASQSQSFINLRTKKFYEKLKREFFRENSELHLQIMSKLSPEAKRAIRNFPKEKQSLLEEVFNKIVDAHLYSLRYIHEPAKTTAERISSGELLAMKVLGVDHLYGVVSYKGNFYLCNKGRRSTPYPGVYSYQINKKDQLENVVQSFLENRKIDDAMRTQYTMFSGSSSQLQIQLGSGKVQQVLRQKNQKSGNCAIASSNSMELLMLYLLFSEVDGLPAEELARAVKSVHAKNRRLSYLEEYLEWHKNDGKNYPVDVPLLVKISKKNTSDPDLDLKFKETVIGWATSPDQDPEITKKVLENLQ